MNKNIGILGGDLRIIFLSQILEKEGYNVYTYGIENFEFINSNIRKCKTIGEICRYCDTIISGIPFSKDGILVNAPFSNNSIFIDDILKNLNSKTIIVGAIKKELQYKAIKNKIKIEDLMEDEKLTILNVIPTVEGAIQVAMQNTEYTIHNSKCLVLGFGRIGKLLSKQLKSLGANVSCMARKDKDLAWISAYGYTGIHLNNLNKNLDQYDIIFNTIPALILDEEKIKKIKNSNTVVIELASKPGGIDYEKAKKYNLKVIEALGLPGKTAPLTSAKYIRETLERRYEI